MLVLRRKPGESIEIGDDVKVVFLGMEGGTAKIGISAPRETNIVRTELTSKSAEFADTKSDSKM